MRTRSTATDESAPRFMRAAAFRRVPRNGRLHRLLGLLFLLGDRTSGHPLQLVWLWSPFLLEFSVVPKPCPDSW